MPLTVVRSYEYRGIGRTGRLPIAASQTYKAGDFLAVNSSGLLIQAATAGNGSSTNGQVASWTSGLTGLIVGRALEDAQPATNDPTIIPTTKLYGTFIVAEPGTQFRVPLYHATAASAYPEPSQLATNYELWNLSTPAGLATGSGWGSNMYVVRVDKTTDVFCQIVDFVPDMYSGWPDVGQNAAPSSGTFSQYADCWIEFLGGTCYLTGARPITRTN
jgi:hypothetical protein